MPQYGYEANDAMLELINHHAFTQFKEKPTRGHNILDHTLSTIPDLVQNSQVVGGISDHDVIITDLNLKVKSSRKVKRKVFIYKKADNEWLNEEISSAWDK